MKKQTGMDESRFKWYLFLLMLGIKVWIIYWIVFHREAGGFTNGEALATIALLLPAFAAYTSPMLADLLRQHNQPPAKPAQTPRIGRRLQVLTWGLVLLYGFFLHSIIGNKAAGRLADNPAANFENMTKWLAILESGLGVYVGLIVGAFFKRSG